MRKIIIGAAVVAAAAGIWLAFPHGHAARDYRDPVQLAQAVKDAEQAKTGTQPASASCGKLAAGKYMCVVAYADGTSGEYGVTVAPDGSSYQAS